MPSNTRYPVPSETPEPGGGITERSVYWRQRPEVLLILVSIAMPVSLFTWQALINNFSIEQAGFSGVDIGILQSVREIPGFLAFAVVFVLLFMREQTLALLSLVLLGLGVALTGFFPSFLGLLVTTTIMSVGFHYFETIRQSLSLQWLSKDRAPAMLGKLISISSLTALVTLGAIYLATGPGGFGMIPVYLVSGGLTVVLGILAWALFPRFSAVTEQRKSLVLRRQYGLFYALTFMAGARRQIFTVFAGFLMVEKFGFDPAAMALMFLASHAISMILAPGIGRLVARWGERQMLTIEYVGLVVVFTAYAFVEVAWLAVGLYVIDHVFFAMAIAIKTYFQKIADPADIASTSGVSFTINHIAAVAIPAVFGLLWIISPGYVFLAGAAMACISLMLARLVPRVPSPENVAALWLPRAAPAE
ncbi:MAG: MFS transporter [Hyphomicrobiales bacterium]|nr:MFS transporter [Hyphomicrobiales bacterium]